jgi:hypothetical protein
MKKEKDKLHCTQLILTFIPILPEQSWLQAAAEGHHKQNTRTSITLNPIYLSVLSIS